MTEIDLFLHSRPVGSVFDLLGQKENDITYSLGWALARSPMLRTAVLKRVFPGEPTPDIEKVCLQESSIYGGYTDVELMGPEVHVIVEAKRGWTLPTAEQLSRYAPRINSSIRHALVVMSECSREYASLHLQQEVLGAKPVYLSWKDIARMSHTPGGTHAEKRLLEQLRSYLGRIVRVQDQTSNMVYVVSLGGGRPEMSEISWIEIVKRGHYFHPVGDGWPKEPPNYIGFRYAGKLQGVHHIDDWEIVDDLQPRIPEIGFVPSKPLFLYDLGPAIMPAREVRTGKVYRNGRVWAMLDLLLTSPTVSEARDLTKQRLEAGPSPE